MEIGDMRIEEYKRQLANHDITKLVEQAQSHADFLRNMARLADLYAGVGEETLRTRRSVKQSRKALDYAEFLDYINAQNPSTAEALRDAEVLKFDWGRIHLRFATDKVKAAFGWHRHTVETLSE